MHKKGSKYKRFKSAFGKLNSVQTFQKQTLAERISSESVAGGTTTNPKILAERTLSDVGSTNHNSVATERQISV